MAWLAVNPEQVEMTFNCKPVRSKIIDYYDDGSCLLYWKPQYTEDLGVRLPKGSIKKLIGKDLTWNDEPVELASYSVSSGVDNEMFSHEIVESCKTSSDAYLDMQFPEIGSNFSLSTAFTSEQIEQNNIYKKLEKSYFEGTKLCEDNSYYNVFQKMAMELKCLPVQNELVSISHFDKTVNITLYLGKKLMLNVAKATSQQDDDNVMFSIALAKKILVVDRMPLHLLVEKVKDIYSKIQN